MDQFTPSENRSDGEKDQRTAEKDQRIKGKHQKMFAFAFARSVHDLNRHAEYIF